MRSARRLGSPKRSIPPSTLLGSMTKFSVAASILLLLVNSTHGDEKRGKHKLTKTISRKLLRTKLRSVECTSARIFQNSNQDQK